jgi:hypothetical protein
VLDSRKDSSIPKWILKSLSSSISNPTGLAAEAEAELYALERLFGLRGESSVKSTQSAVDKEVEEGDGTLVLISLGCNGGFFQPAAGGLLIVHAAAAAAVEDSMLAVRVPLLLLLLLFVMDDDDNDEVVEVSLRGGGLEAADRLGSRGFGAAAAAAAATVGGLEQRGGPAADTVIVVVGLGFTEDPSRWVQHATKSSAALLGPTFW